MNIEMPKIRTKAETEVEQLKVQFDELKAENNELKIKNTKLQLLGNIKESFYFVIMAITLLIIHIMRFQQLETPTKGDVIQTTVLATLWGVIAVLNISLIISNIIAYNNTPPKE